jgi:chromosomal replication initiation ATPase DnaA
MSFARQIAMYLAHTQLGLSYTGAGNLFGRDRTTARHACRQVEDRREDPRVDSMLDCLERAICLSTDLVEYRKRAAGHAA